MTHRPHRFDKKFPTTTSAVIIVVLLLSPYIVAFEPNPSDSSSTSIEAILGAGSYAHVSRDCSGRVLGVTNIPFQEGEVSVEHEFSHASLGVRGGFTSVAEDKDYQGYEYSPQTTSVYVNPRVAMNTGFVGANFGVVLFNQKHIAGRLDMGDALPSIKVRLGYLDSWYVSSSFCDNMPILSGGGLFDFGVGFSTGKQNSSLWIGVGAGPYDSGVLSAKGVFPLSDKVLLDARGLIGTGVGSEYGLALGTKILF